MNFLIRQGHNDDIEELVRLSLLAWAPVFASFQNILGPAIFPLIYPEDWQTIQARTVTTFCMERENSVVWVAEVDGHAVGFLVCDMNHQDKTGEVQLLAVHPDYQNAGIGTELNNFALTQMKESGIKLAAVSTGGDPSHAPARRCYEKAGYTGLPSVRYYQAL